MAKKKNVNLSWGSSESDWASVGVPNSLVLDPIENLSDTPLTVPS
jgi:hypothetical protein